MSASGVYTFDHPIYGLEERFIPFEGKGLQEGGGEVIPDLLEELYQKAGPAYRGALEVLSRHITRVSYLQFLQNLETAALPVRELLPRSIVMVEPGKSDMWVAQLASSQLTEVAALYMAHGSEGVLNRGLEAYRRAHPEGDIKSNDLFNNIVFFDDAAYSGRQITDTVKRVAQIMKRERPHAPLFHIVLPYISRAALARLSGLEKEGIAVRVYFASFINTLSEIVRSLPTAEALEIQGSSPTPGEEVLANRGERE